MGGGQCRGASPSLDMVSSINLVNTFRGEGHAGDEAGGRVSSINLVNTSRSQGHAGDEAGGSRSTRSNENIDETQQERDRCAGGVSAAPSHAHKLPPFPNVLTQVVLHEPSSPLQPFVPCHSAGAVHRWEDLA